MFERVQGLRALRVDSHQPRSLSDILLHGVPRLEVMHLEDELVRDDLGDHLLHDAPLLLVSQRLTTSFSEQPLIGVPFLEHLGDVLALVGALGVMDGLIQLVSAPFTSIVDLVADPPPNLQAVRVLHVAEDLPCLAHQIDIEEGPQEMVHNHRILLDPAVQLLHVLHRDHVRLVVLSPLQQLLAHR